MSYIRQIGTVKAPISTQCAYCHGGDADMAMKINDDLFYYHRTCFAEIERSIAEGGRNLLLAIGKTTEITE